MKGFELQDVPTFIEVSLIQLKQKFEDRHNEGIFCKFWTIDCFGGFHMLTIAGGILLAFAVIAKCKSVILDRIA